MALDAANFIAELSITDPPGSDPLSQGDDQIRTIKRATQQSFPLIAAAVNLTDAQMNLAAIKNEANIFTTSQTAQDSNWQIDSIADNERGLLFRKGSITRWTFAQRTDSDNNDLAVRRNDVLGALLDRPFIISAVTGIVDFAQPPTVAGAPLWIAGELRMFAATATPGTNWFLADGTNGTVDMTDRAVIASGTSAAGSALNPNLVGTAAAGTSGGTAITEAQMPAHNHTVWMTNNFLGGLTDSNLNDDDNVFGGRRNDTSKQFSKSNASREVMGNAGSGNSHNHSVPSRAVTENGTDRNTVRPFSRVVEMHQYVP